MTRKPDSITPNCPSPPARARRLPEAILAGPTLSRAGARSWDARWRDDVRAR